MSALSNQVGEIDFNERAQFPSGLQSFSFWPRAKCRRAKVSFYLAACVSVFSVFLRLPTGMWLQLKLRNRMYLYLCMWMCQSKPQLALVSPALVLARSAPAPAAAAAADVEKSRKNRRVTATIHPPESIFWPAFVSGSLSHCRVFRFSYLSDFFVAGASFIYDYLCTTCSMFIACR